MAFATQWAQGSRRQSERYMGLDDASLDPGFDEIVEEGFDRDLQRHFWNQAQKALQETEHIECYRIAGAEMVLSLAQRPWAQDDVDAFFGERQCARIEETLAATTSLYRYWNVAHGAFFRELLRDFYAVPGRIRSWFFCISAHWHLAVLMLADLVEQIDDEGLSLPCAGRRRAAGKMAAAMREASVREPAGLSRVATPRAARTEPHLPGFHHAVNEGTVLTEPWTIILIRAFSRAAVLFMEEADNYRRYGLTRSWGGVHDGWNSLERADDCVRTLFYLGKKSDMARRVADILSGALASLRATEDGSLTGSGDASGGGGGNASTASESGSAESGSVSLESWTTSTGGIDPSTGNLGLSEGDWSASTADWNASIGAQAICY
ncbi:hypothetical protein ACHAQH_009838 [Verticillium albo-atrum]